MDARQSFKFAFISRCIEHGITEIGDIRDAAKVAADRLEKRAGLGGAIWDTAKSFGGAIWDTAKSFGGAGLTTALAAPPLLGYAAGTLASNAGDVDDFDADEAKKQEILDEYHRQAARSRHEGLVRRFEAGQPVQRSRSFF